MTRAEIRRLDTGQLVAVYTGDLPDRPVVQFHAMPKMKPLYVSQMVMDEYAKIHVISLRRIPFAFNTAESGRVDIPTYTCRPSDVRHLSKIRGMKRVY